MKQHGMVIYETHTYYISHFFHHRIIFIDFKLLTTTFSLHILICSCKTATH